MESQRDRCGRRSRLKAISTGKRISLQSRDRQWLQMLAEHGPLPSSFLLARTAASHASEKRAKERLTDLFHEANTKHGGAYLVRPPQQFRTIDSRYNQLVYDLAPAGIAALTGMQEEVRSARSGPWLHSLMVSCTTASIELACLARSDVNYIPQSRILARADTSLRWPTPITDPRSGASYTKDLLPDAVFGLEYLTRDGSKFRFFAVEADRSTEPATSSNFHRKSFERHLLQYQAYIEQRGYSAHLRLSAPMLVLNVVNDEQRIERLLSAAGLLFPSGNSYQLFQAWEQFGPIFAPPQPNPNLLEAPWLRVGEPDMGIDLCS